MSEALLPKVQVSIKGQIPDFYSQQLTSLMSSFLGIDRHSIYISQGSYADFSDAGLWSMVEEDLATSEKTRLSELIIQEKHETLTSPEADELNRLTDRVDELMLQRSYALAELQKRGYDIHSYLKTK